MIALPIDKSIVKKEVVWCVMIGWLSVKESKRKLSQDRWYSGYGQHSFNSHSYPYPYQCRASTALF
jgi:hypothetical protein